MRYRAKVELYDEHENRVEVAWTPVGAMAADDPRWRREIWELAFALVKWIRERRA